MMMIATWPSNLKLRNRSSEEYVLRNKQLLNDHHTVKHAFRVYERVLNDSVQAASPIKALLDEFLTELGTHCMSLSELNLILNRNREKRSRCCATSLASTSSHSSSSSHTRAPMPASR